MKILFVCEGNICRSPMAEVIFLNLAKKENRTDITVKSAGTWAYQGAPMTELSRQALVDCGEELPETPHAATQFSNQMNNEYDHMIDCRGFPDPYGHNLDAYIEVCKWLQVEVKKLYNQICKTL